MSIEAGRFSDGRLKAIRRLNKKDSNVRDEGTEVTIVSKKDMATLESEVIEAFDLHNLITYVHPELKKEIYQYLYQRGYLASYNTLSVAKYFRYEV
jgi:hypothetical protein